MIKKDGRSNQLFSDYKVNGMELFTITPKWESMLPLMILMFTLYLVESCSVFVDCVKNAFIQKGYE